MRLDDHYQSIQHDCIMSALVEAQELNIVTLLKPKIFKDGNQWCVLYGENIQEGVCGFGDSPMKAVCAFNKAFHESINQIINR